MLFGQRFNNGLGAGIILGITIDNCFRYFYKTDTGAVQKDPDPVTSPTVQVQLQPKFNSICPYGIPTVHIVEEKSDSYVTSINTRLRLPEWVAEHLTKESFCKKERGVSRSHSRFTSDQAVPKHLNQTASDYKNSGYSKGHLAAAANHKETQQTLDATFQLSSNIVPQEMCFNGSDWLRLEYLTRKLPFDHVFVISGPLFLPDKMSKSEKVQLVQYPLIGHHVCFIPTHLFKVILAEDDAGKRRCAAAFVIPNKPAPIERPLTDYQISIKDLEIASGIQMHRKLKHPLRRVKDLCAQANGELCKYPDENNALIMFWRRLAKLKAAKSIKEADEILEKEMDGKKLSKSNWRNKLFLDAHTLVCKKHKKIEIVD
eukprot:GSMAST32.ASY1.ANO1.653.1 assembled CDS